MKTLSFAFILQLFIASATSAFFDLPGIEMVEINSPNYVCYGSLADAKDLVVLVDSVNEVMAQGSRGEYLNGTREGINLNVFDFVLYRGIGFTALGNIMNMKMAFDVQSGLGKIKMSNQNQVEEVEIKCVFPADFDPSTDYL